nr:Rid family hydrolase [uncultured Alistipes sp.]
MGVSVDDRFTRQYCNFGAMNEVYARFFNGQMPARVCCQVAALPKGAKS